MPPRAKATTARKATSPAVKPAAPTSALTSGTAVLLAGGGEAIFLAQDGEMALLRVGTSHQRAFREPLERLELVDADSETERHAKFRADARRRGEIGS